MHFCLVAGEVVKPTVTIHPSVLRVQQGTRVEFHCTATGNPTPSVEWTGKALEKLTLKIWEFQKKFAASVVKN